MPHHCDQNEWAVAAKIQEGNMKRTADNFVCNLVPNKCAGPFFARDPTNGSWSGTNSNITLEKDTTVEEDIEAIDCTVPTHSMSYIAPDGCKVFSQIMSCSNCLSKPLSQPIAAKRDINTSSAFPTCGSLAEEQDGCVENIGFHHCFLQDRDCHG